MGLRTVCQHESEDTVGSGIQIMTSAVLESTLYDILEDVEHGSYAVSHSERKRIRIGY